MDNQMDKVKDLMDTSSTEITIIGILILVILAIGFVAWKLWKANEEINLEVRGMIGKYHEFTSQVLMILKMNKK